MQSSSFALPSLGLPWPPLPCLALPCPSLLAFGSYPTVSPSVPTLLCHLLFLALRGAFSSYLVIFSVFIFVSLYFYRSVSWFLSILSFLVPLFCLVRFLLFRVAFSTCPSMALSLPTLPYPLFSLFHSLSTFLCPIILFLSFHVPFSPYPCLSPSFLSSRSSSSTPISRSSIFIFPFFLYCPLSSLFLSFSFLPLSHVLFLPPLSLPLLMAP